jgi:hypothetical protein
MLVQTAQEANIWDSVARALETEPRDHKVLTGVSGLEHSVQMLGVDEKRNRVIAVSSEPNSRIAALMQVDVQAAMPGMKVLVARPIVVDLGVIVRTIFPNDGSAVLVLSKFASINDRINKLPDKAKKRAVDRQYAAFLPQIVRAFEKTPLPAVTQIMDIVQQISNLDWAASMSAISGGMKDASIPLARLRHIDNLETDRKNGICALPLYEFSENDWDLLAGGGHIDDVKQRLKVLGIYQYFFPAADQLALGLADRQLSGTKEIIEMVERAPKLGHPFGDLELVKDRSSLPKMLEELKESGYVAEGEHGVEITPEGGVIRSTIKFRPRESLFQRVLNRLSMNVSVSPKDFFPK